MIKKTPKDGDYRYIWRFHWLPRYYSSNGCWVWLEKKYVRQIYFNVRIFIHGWYDVCLSNPKTGLPLEI